MFLCFCSFLYFLACFSFFSFHCFELVFLLFSFVSFFLVSFSFFNTCFSSFLFFFFFFFFLCFLFSLFHFFLFTFFLPFLEINPCCPEVILYSAFSLDGTCALTTCCTALMLSAQVITSLKRKESFIAEIHLSFFSSFLFLFTFFFFKLFFFLSPEEDNILHTHHLFQTTREALGSTLCHIATHFKKT